MKSITLLGSTGSIGKQTLDVMNAHPDKFKLVAMSFGKNVSAALDIIHKFQPSLVCAQTKEIKEEIENDVSPYTVIVYGEKGLIDAAHYESDLVVNAMVGRAGLEPTLAAIHAGKTVAIANKETLVTAGHLVMEAAKKHDVSVLPVDSEHSAIFQCLQGENAQAVSSLILTASGGSFRDRSRQDLAHVTVADALKHPNWSMGQKNTIDSATMMNKGLEVIEAHWLFGMSYDQIDVWLHRESMIHALVEFADKSVTAQLSEPDMRIPIQYALAYPQRLELTTAKRLNLWETAALHFEKMDLQRFRCLALAFEAGKIGGTMPTVLNAANEAAVQLFLEHRLSFLGIEEKIEEVLERHTPIKHPNLEEIKAVDIETHRFVEANSSTIK